MHDYMTPGNYYHPKSSTAKTLVNCPLTYAFQLKVTAPIENSTGGYLLQEYTAFDGKSVVKVHYDPYLQEWVEPVVYITKDDLNERFSASDSGTIYNSVSDFPATGSGFGTNTKNLTLYTGFVIPAFSRICFMNYGNSRDGALIAIDPDGNLYSAFRNVGVWQNGKVR